MSAYDLLSRDQKDRLHKKWAEDEKRFSELAVTLEKHPDFIDRLAIHAASALPLPMRDDVALLRALKARMHRSIAEMAAESRPPAKRLGETHWRCDVCGKLWNLDSTALPGSACDQGVCRG
jgi:hypothetical protein